MRTMLCGLLALALSSIALADDLGETKVFKKAQLPSMRSISANSADVIFIVEEVKPDDIKTIKAGSDNPDVKVRAVEMNGEVRIVITGEKKADAKVSWSYTTEGGMEGGYANLMVHILK